MDAGAAGFATSYAVTHMGADGRPIPSRWAAPDELEMLCRAVGDSGRGVCAVNGGEGLSFRDTYRLQPKVGVPFTFTAILTTPNGSHLKAMEIHRAGRAAGVDVWPQVSCRPLSFSMTMIEPFSLNTNPVFAELIPQSLDARRAAYGDPAWRSRVREAWKNTRGLAPRWDAFEVMESTRPELCGANIGRLAAERGSDPLDVLLDITLAEPELALRVKALLANDDAVGVELLLKEDHCTLGLSDAGAHVGQLCDAVLSTDLLGTWVRDRHVLTMEDAIHKLTQQQADIFGFTDRGVLRAGAHADVVVFDPETVAPGPLRRVADFPAGAERLTADQPTGMRHLMVNGQWVQRDGTFADESRTARPGMLVKPGRP
jgi:N-acyl-D-aspartate/D-glutamate deacylase